MAWSQSPVDGQRPWAMDTRLEAAARPWRLPREKSTWQDRHGPAAVPLAAFGEELPDGRDFELEDILSAIAGDVLTAASAD